MKNRLTPSVSPLPRPHAFESIEAVVRELKPNDPVYCLHTEKLRNNVHKFQALFPGHILYAVKCNPHPAILAGLYDAGIRNFDTASLPEIAQAQGAFSGATSYFMHPVKSRDAIKAAYLDYGVRTFVLDHDDELEKILQVIPSRDLCLVVRLHTDPAAETAYHLSSKFGCGHAQAVNLMKKINKAGCKAGLAFHVGSQCGSPQAYSDGLAKVNAVIRESEVIPSMVDVGGGFPCQYLNSVVPPLEEYMQVIRDGAAQLHGAGAFTLVCEPGRALVADACSLLVQVQLRKGHQIYLNDGVYGSLGEMFFLQLRLPVRALRSQGPFASATQEFQLFGPTCDSLDALPGVFSLPEDLQEGDWLEFSNVGAYSYALASGFNGFFPENLVEIKAPT
jgi:ornithine decarboxylase